MERIENQDRLYLERLGEEINPVMDVITAPSFIASKAFLAILQLYFGTTVVSDLAKKMNDIYNIINEQKTGVQSLSMQVKAAMEAFFTAFGDEHRERPIVGVGYSGGFVPVVDAIQNGRYEYEVNAYVALGGATVAIGAELAKLLVNIIAAIEQVITARTPESREAYKRTFDAFKLGFTVIGAQLASQLAGAASQFINGLGLVYETLGQGAVDAAAAAFYDHLAVFIQSMSGFGWGDSVEAKMLVNIYGSEDWLVKKMPSIVGYRSQWAGFTAAGATKPLFNIEIEGADHFDYILGVDPTKTGDALTRNEIIAGYVADIIVNSDDPEKLRRYLDLLIRNQRAERIGSDSYKLINLW